MGPTVTRRIYCVVWASNDGEWSASRRLAYLRALDAAACLHSLERDDFTAVVLWLDVEVPAFHPVWKISEAMTQFNVTDVTPWGE